MKLEIIYVGICNGFGQIWLCPESFKRLSQYLAGCHGSSITDDQYQHECEQHQHQHQYQHQHQHRHGHLTTIFHTYLYTFWHKFNNILFKCPGFKRISSKKINEHCQEIQIRTQTHEHTQKSNSMADTCVFLYATQRIHMYMCCARKLPLILSFFVVLNRSTIFHFARFSFRCSHMKYKGCLG